MERKEKTMKYWAEVYFYCIIFWLVATTAVIFEGLIVEYINLDFPYNAIAITLTNVIILLFIHKILTNKYDIVWIDGSIAKLLSMNTVVGKLHILLLIFMCPMVGIFAIVYLFYAMDRNVLYPGQIIIVAFMASQYFYPFLGSGLKKIE